MKTKLAVILLFVAVGALSLLAVNGSPTTPQVKPVEDYSTLAPASSLGIQAIEPLPSAVPEESPSIEAQGLSTRDWVRALEYSVVRKKDPFLLEPGPAEANFRALLEQADSGNPAASLSVFHLSESCGLIDGAGQFSKNPSRSSSSCQTLATRGVSLQQFAVAAANGGELAALVPLLAMARSQARRAPGSESAIATAEAAIFSLEQATKFGYAEAFVLLAQTYRDGVIVSPDFVKSFIYMDAYARGTGDSAAAREAKHMSKNLRVGDKVMVDQRQSELMSQIVKNRALEPR